VAEADLPADFKMERIRTTPQCREIYQLTKEPIQKAVPAIIQFLADPDQSVQIYATMAIRNYGADAEPYLKDALVSQDRKILGGVLFVVEMERFSSLNQEVRKIVWDVDDVHIRLSAISTLQWFKDADGLREISLKHPSDRVRTWAKQQLHYMEEKKGIEKEKSHSSQPTPK
jgi:HEAT repeat protein